MQYMLRAFLSSNTTSSVYIKSIYIKYQSKTQLKMFDIKKGREGDFPALK